MNARQHELRTQCIKILIERFRNKPEYSTLSMFDCAEDWVQKGYVNTSGLVKYYEAYYA